MDGKVFLEKNKADDDGWFWWKDELATTEGEQCDELEDLPRITSLKHSVFSGGLCFESYVCRVITQKLWRLLFQKVHTI